VVFAVDITLESDPPFTKCVNSQGNQGALHVTEIIPTRRLRTNKKQSHNACEVSLSVSSQPGRGKL
jgi:hypothetical protein